MSTTTYPVTGKASLPTQPHLMHTLLFALWWLLGSILVVILALPVLLAFVATAIPRYLALGLIILDLAVVIALFRLKRTWRIILGFWCSVIAVTLLTIWLSQVFAATPPILDANNRPLPNSIAVLEKVNLGGSEQWITIRGKDVTKPVLLYLGIGGPGAGGFPASALSLKPLEDHFVVVNWDQPGTGKSYNAVPISTLTVERFVADAHELTQRLRARFHQDKIYVLGLSWGTILGIKLVQQYPDLFYAYIGTGQMVNTTENDRMGYELALRLVTEQGDTATANTLRRYGPPPYAGAGMALKYAVYNNVLFRYMDSPTLQLVLLLVPQFAREYGFVDKVNFARGLIESYAVIYPQLRDLDFTTQAAKLGTPIYFLVGRHDVNAMTSLVERYYNMLQAPHKELIWLESAHGATAKEIEDALVNHVLAANP